jgi:glycosyltransferase involved in cell wall biosynthesis
VRVTFVLPGIDFSGGVRVVAMYAEALARFGHQTTVVYPAPAVPPLKRKVKSLLRGQGWPVQVASPPSHLDGRVIERRVIAPHRPIVSADLADADVVVATWWETAEWVARLDASKGAKVYFVQHDETVFSFQPVERVAATYRLGLHKITIARWLVDLMRDRYGDREVSLVPNAVDTSQFQSPPRGKQPKPTVGLLYGRQAFKGTDIVLRALALARQRLPELSVVAFGGEPPERPDAFPTGTSFTINPTQAEIPKLYARCDAWLFGSRSEGFGLPLLEAMACRTPIIATPAGAAPELVAAGGGLPVRHENPEDMCRAILELCAMPNEPWRALSARAHAIASSYSWDDAARQFERALAATTPAGAVAAAVA